MWATWLSLAAIAGSAGLAMGWRGDDPPPPPPREQDGAMFDREAMRARVQRRMDEMERELARMKEFKQRLDNGEAPPRMERPWSEGAKKGDGLPRERVREMMERRRGEEHGPGAGGPPKGAHEGGPGEKMDYESLRPRLLETAPGVVEIMDRLRERNREVADRVWQRMTPRFKEAAALRERDPQGFQLKAEEVRTGLGVILAIGEVREAKEKSDDAALTTKRAALRDAVAKQVDARIATQRHEVEALDARLAGLRKSLDSQVQDREKTIDERAKKMEDAPEGMMGESEKPAKPKVPAKK